MYAPVLALLVALFVKSSVSVTGAVILGLALLAGVLSSVHHAEVIAARVGDPFGAIILALAVTVIELGLIVSVMIGPHPEPTLVRDTMHAVVVLVLHGLAGLCIVVGAIKHREQEFRTQGAQAYLTVLLPMIAITLILPNHTVASPGPYYSGSQLIFVSACCLLLWLAFTFVQTIRNRDYFVVPVKQKVVTGPRPDRRTATIALGMLLVALAAVVLLAQAVTPIIQGAVEALGAPPALVGVIVATIVLLPEATTAVRAALTDRLQTSINLALGSAVSSIGLTVPTVAMIAWWTGHPLELGISDGGALLLGLSFLMAMITYGNGRSSLLSGVVHLILLGMWLVFLIAP
jgi:Ca2+:H+ antiporter